MGIWDRLTGKDPARRRPDIEIAAEIASLLESSVIETGPRTLLSPTACVTINALGMRGFALFSALPEGTSTYVSLADLPAMRRVRDLFNSIGDLDSMPPELVAEMLAALLPPCIDRLAIEVWEQFKSYTKPGGMPPPLPPR